MENKDNNLYKARLIITKDSIGVGDVTPDYPIDILLAPGETIRIRVSHHKENTQLFANYPIQVYD